MPDDLIARVGDVDERAMGIARQRISGSPVRPPAVRRRRRSANRPSFAAAVGQTGDGSREFPDGRMRRARDLRREPTCNSPPSSVGPEHGRPCREKARRPLIAQVCRCRCTRTVSPRDSATHATYQGPVRTAASGCLQQKPQWRRLGAAFLAHGRRTDRGSRIRSPMTIPVATLARCGRRY